METLNGSPGGCQAPTARFGKSFLKMIEFHSSALRQAVPKKVIKIVIKVFPVFRLFICGGLDGPPEDAEAADSSMQVAQRDSTQRHGRGLWLPARQRHRGWRCGIHAAAQRQSGRVGFAAPGHVTPGRVADATVSVADATGLRRKNLATIR